MPALVPRARFWMWLVPLALAALLPTFGCQPSPGAKLVGTWKMEAASGGVLSKLTERVNLTFTFRQDGTWVTEMPSPVSNQSVSQSGAWKFIEAKGNELTIQLAPRKGDDAPTQRLKVLFVEDDVVEFVPPSSLFRSPVKFRRVQSN